MPIIHMAKHVEMKYGVDSWAGILGSFKGYYFRTEANVGHATYGLRGMEVFTALDIDSGTTGIGSLTGLYSELLVKAPATSFTIGGYPNAIEANFSYEQAQPVQPQLQTVWPPS